MNNLRIKPWLSIPSRPSWLRSRMLAVKNIFLDQDPEQDVGYLSPSESDGTLSSSSSTLSNSSSSEESHRARPACRTLPGGRWSPPASR